MSRLDARGVPVCRSRSRWASVLAGLVALSFAAAGEAATPVTVRLNPHAEAVGADTLVTFGVPVPPGVLASVDTVLVRDETGTEIPIFVKASGQYATMPPAAMLCSGLSTTRAPGLRGVIVQFRRTFTSTAPLSFVVDLDATPTQPRRAEENARTGYRAANEGSYTSSFGVQEPRVYAQLPADWLSCSNLVANERALNTSAVPNNVKTNLSTFFDRAVTPSESQPYQTGSEPWLYDRATVFLTNYIRTGELKYLREGVRATQHYASLVNSSGYFSRANGDAKYAYNESPFLGYLLTGDGTLLPKIPLVAAALRGAPDDDPMAPGAFFTERHTAMRLHAAVTQYMNTGAVADRNYIATAIGHIQTMQNNPMFRARAG